MHIPANHQTLLGDFTGDFMPRDNEDESCEVELGARMADSGSGGEGSNEGGSPVSGNRGNGGCIRDRPVKVIPCPRCQSMNTKFCYYNNYSVNQPRHFCRNCQRYWTVGGTLRNVPVGGGSRKKTRTRSRNDAHPYGVQISPVGSLSGGSDGLLNASSCMQQLSMLPPALGGFGPAFAPTTAGSQLPFLQFAMEQGGLFPPKTGGGPLAGLQEVPDLQSLYDAPQVPQISHVNSVTSSPMLGSGFFLPDLANAPSSDALASVMAKAGLWSSAPVQQLQALACPPSWEDRSNLKTNSPALTSHLLSGYEDRKNTLISPHHQQQQQAQQANATVLPQSWAAKQASFWETSPLQQQPQSRPMMHHDRLVPHTAWDDSNHHRNVSPNGSNITTEDDRCLPSDCFSRGYHEDHVVSQPWVGLQASDILQF